MVVIKLPVVTVVKSLSVFGSSQNVTYIFNTNISIHYYKNPFFQILIQNLIREYLTNNQYQFQMNRRQDVLDNEIDIDYTDLKPPPFRREETEENKSDKEDIDSSESRSDSESKSLEHDDDHGNNRSDENNAAEESVEDNKPTIGNGNGNSNGNQNASNGDSKSKQDSNGDNGNEDASDYDSDEPPEGDGQGGGILGLLAGLSGGVSMITLNEM